MSQSIKISELIAVLQQKLDRFGDLDVHATWEGISRDLGPIYRGRTWETQPWRLFIDAEGDGDFSSNRYRKEFEHPEDQK